ncbi:MAG: endonuclease/exonuclease/phosphatase, partial [Gammaproteobacteria bacterium]|nr:endonuclease/exonuclease/phosphatase [Gammaproteobacteria bacterium]
VFKFEDMTVENMLSDHCAVSVDLQPVESFLSPGLTWLQTSKEFELMTLGIYKRAEMSLDTLDLPENNWVVVMDVDETVLDNSNYEKLMIAKGTSYASDTWDMWVASEQATLVPGVKSFIDKVFAKGGKVAFITNREKVDDDHTWNNLTAVGISVTPENSCLMGRGDIDVKSVEKPEYINDKDLRRQQIRQGTADCYAVVPSWQAEHTIVMQVGDNIKDIEGITQEGAVPSELLPRLDKDIILLLNPTYGSW